jgi:hypothetical protein
MVDWAWVNLQLHEDRQARVDNIQRFVISRDLLKRGA